jgi:hypothetical protein
MMRENARLRAARESRANRRDSGAPDVLARVEVYVRIASAIFIPVAIAFTGWWVQSSVAEATIKKDYVSMAMNILKEGKADPQLVTWAAEVVRQNSPTPLTNELHSSIIRASLSASQAKITLEMPSPPERMMVPPKPLTKFPDTKLLASGTLSSEAVLAQWLNDRHIAEENAINLKYLQIWMVGVQKSDKDLREQLLDISTQQVIRERQIMRDAGK